MTRYNDGVMLILMVFPGFEEGWLPDALSRPGCRGAGRRHQAAPTAKASLCIVTHSASFFPTNTCTHVHVHTKRAHIHMHTCVRTHKTYTHTYAHTYICTHTQAHIYTSTLHTHKHMCTHTRAHIHRDRHTARPWRRGSGQQPQPRERRPR